MKNRTYLITAFLCCTSFGEDFPQEQKGEFVDFYREWSDLTKEFPEDLTVKVMFVDLNADGVPEAFATDKGATYEENQSDWFGFSKVGDTWKPLEGVNPVTEEVVSGISLFGRPGEFLRITRPDGEIKFLILGKNFDNQLENGLGEPSKVLFSLSPAGILKSEILDNLEFLTGDVQGGPKAANKIERIKVESFSK